MKDCRYEEIKNISVSTIIVGSVILAGIIVSYLPQVIKICWKKSSEGLSPWYILLGGCSTFYSFLNMFLMKYECCMSLPDQSVCVNMILPVLQTFFQWFMFQVMAILYFFYFPASLKHKLIDLDFSISEETIPTAATATATPKTMISKENSGCSSIKSGITSLTIPEEVDVNNICNHESSRKLTKYWRDSIFSGVVISVNLVACLTLTVVFIKIELFNLQESITSNWGRGLGYAGMTMTVIQLLPQIYTTFKTKKVGALSIPTLCIHAPGAYVLALFFAFSPGSDFSTYATPIASGTLTLILLILAVKYHFKEKSKQRRSSCSSQSSKSSMESCSSSNSNDNYDNNNTKNEDAKILITSLENSRDLHQATSATILNDGAFVRIT